MDAEQRLARARRRDPLLLAAAVEDELPLGEVMITSQAHLAYIGRQGPSVGSLGLLGAWCPGLPRCRVLPVEAQQHVV